MSRREKEAADWFARMRSPDADRHRTVFEAWRGDHANAAAYADAEIDWLAVGGVASTDIASIRTLPARSRSIPPRWAMAAALFLALALGCAWYLQASPHRPQLAGGKHAADQLMRLADGSEVQLMDGAQIETRFEGNERRIILTGGRARFTVAHDRNRPFVVAAGRSETTALGTIFEVDLRTARARVHLIKGAVEVRASGSGKGGAAVRLAPGESAEVEDSDVRRLPPMASPVAATRLDADNLALGAVIAQTNRINAVPIRLADPALAPRRLTGRFDIADSAALARKLAAALDLNLVSRPDGYLLSAKPKKPGE